MTMHDAEETTSRFKTNKTAVQFFIREGKHWQCTTCNINYVTQKENIHEDEKCDYVVINASSGLFKDI